MKKVWRLMAAALMAVAVPTGLLAACSADAAGPGWRLVKPAAALAFDAELVATGPNDAWAFGAYAGDSWIPPEAFHWDGRSWRGTELPARAPGIITAASVSGPDNVWAGFTARSGKSSVALRWDGHTWSAAKVFPGLEEITEVLALGPQDVWVFGTEDMHRNTGVAWHRTTGDWVRTELPAMITHSGARSADDIWALGGPGVLHYDGKRWNDIPMTGAYPDTTARPLLSGIAVAQDGIWISAELDGVTRPSVETLLLHRSGPGWKHERVTAKAGRWNPDQSTPVPDGKGGLWLRGSIDENGDDSALVHRSAAGVWTRTPITVDGHQAEVGALVRIPGTSHLLAAGEYSGNLPFSSKAGVFYLP